MRRGILLAKRLREVFIDGRWIANTNYQHQVKQLDWEQATQKVGNLNTVALLTYHINYYLAGILSAIETGKLEIRDKYSFDMPEITNQKDWDILWYNLILNAEKFAKHVEAMEDDELERPFIAEEYGSYLRNIEGVIEHSYYHLGQITLIGKMVNPL